MREDPYQLDNLATIMGEELEEQRLMLAELAKCAGKSCQQYNHNYKVGEFLGSGC